MSSYNIYNNINSLDLILIGNPQITYFTTVYRRHTFFQIIRGTPQNVKTGEKVRVNREGAHLLKQVIVKMTINYSGSYIPHNIGTSMLDNISYRFDNDEIIEKISGKYIEIYNQLSTKPHCKSVYTKNGSDIEVASGDGLNHLSYSGGVYNSSGTFSGKISIELPIPFSFSNSVGNAIPYFLSKDNELYIIAKLNDYEVTTFEEGANKLQIILEHIVLSETEKNRFAKNNSEYILTRIYEVEWAALGERLSISQQNSYNSVKTLIWAINNSSDNSFSANNYSFSIKINNMNITPYLNYQYYTRVFPKKAGLIGYGRGLSSASMVCVDDSICYYTFGLKEGFDNEFDSPNGSINTSINQLELFKHSDSSRDPIILYMLSYDIITYQKSGAPPILKFSPKKLHD